MRLLTRQHLLHGRGEVTSLHCLHQLVAGLLVSAHILQHSLWDADKIFPLWQSLEAGIVLHLIHLAEQRANRPLKPSV